LGIGTEKIETAAQALFPDAKVARMDRDTTAGKGSVIKILKKLKNQEIDILVGTQMVAKGHDFPNITLVGIICADMSLNFPDFRAGEQTFQLLAQVAGRAGRGAATGRVVLQTYNPDHFSIKAASNQDNSEFYNKEIKYRQALNYPPFSRIIQIRLSGKDKKKTKIHALFMGEMCRKLLEENSSFIKHIEVLGPVEAPLPKISGHYRWQILLKGLGSGHLHKFIIALLFTNKTGVNKKGVKVAVDVDPFSMM
jgi:primosomal protein N' (replication factor Y)